MWSFVKWLSLKVMFFINSGRIITLVVGALCEIWQFNTDLYRWYEIFVCFSYKNEPLYYINFYILTDFANNIFIIL